MKNEAWFWPVTAVLLAIMAAVMVTSASKENQTLDEGVHLVSGYSHLLKRDFRLTPEHPPLAKMMCALPVAMLRPDFPDEPELWARADGYQLGSRFLYHNRIPAQTLLMAGRMVTILMTLALGLLLAVWLRRECSVLAAVAGLTLYAFDPNIIAHGRYITTDLAVTFFFFATCLSWHGYLAHPSLWRLYRTGLLVGLALSSKYSALLLIPALALLYVLRRVKIPARHALAAFVVVPFAIVWMLFMFEIRSISQDPLFKGKTTEAAVLQDVPVPAYYWFRGLHLIYRFEHSRPDRYLLGEVRRGGSWMYFPVAFLVKTPLPTLLMFLLAVFYGRKVAKKYPVLVIAPAIYLLVSILSSINIGIRHILPVYPFLFAFAAATLASVELKKAIRGAFVALCCILVLTSAASYPDYLPFFNLAVGGAKNGPRYLLDSNLDWGQDLIKLKRWSDERGMRPPKLIAYFGGADPAYYGFDPVSDPRDTNTAGLQGRVVAISAHYLYGSKDDRFGWLRNRQPMARIGHSIFVYDLRPGRI